MRKKKQTKRIVSTRTPLGKHHTVEVTPWGDYAILRVFDAKDHHLGIEMEIVATPAGPSVRVRAQSVELETLGAVAVRCEAFEVDARQAIMFRAGGRAKIEAEDVRIDARVGAAIVQANDDVQLLGEQILLNCDRQPPMPEWVQPSAPVQHVALAAHSGDEPLLETLQNEST